MLPLSAQIASGTIDYTEHFSMDFGDWMSAARKKEMEAQMAAGAFDMTGRLSFHEGVFSYTQLPVEEGGGGGNSWQMRANENPEIYYIDTNDSMRTDRRQIMDRTFIIEEEWETPNWNIANMKVGMKELPLPNQLATAITAAGDTLTAYYTESIPVSIGPKGYGGLPGAILYLKVLRDGRVTEYTMKTMQPGMANLDLTKPDDDKKITREEFDKQMERAKKAMERRRRSWERD